MSDSEKSNPALPTTQLAAAGDAENVGSTGKGARVSATAESLRTESASGRRFGRYVLGPALGQGGAGTVFKAHDTLLEIPVALKLPRLDADAGFAKTANFLLEARTLARLNHTQLCRVFDYGEIDGQPFISMAFIDGHRLERVADPRKTADVVRTIALALAQAHAIGVIHRDLKPANIVVTSHGDPIVVDFGLAIRRGEQGDSIPIDPTIAGTLPYMSPEQIAGSNEELDARTDVYSLGVILYELVTGRRPFETGNVVDLTIRATPPSQLDSAVDPALDAVCLRAIEQDATLRFQSMREFASALEGYLSQGAQGRAQVDPQRIAFAFLPVGSTVVGAMQHQDQLYLDVGNQLAAGVVDHHAREAQRGSTTACLVAQPDLVLATRKPWRKSEAAFKIVLHENPDLDSVSAAFLAMRLLDESRLPQGAVQLAEYVDAINSGSSGISPTNRYSLYAAYLLLTHRLSLRTWPSRASLWQHLVREGLQALAYVLETATRTNEPIESVDAFAAPGLFGPLDRREVEADRERYERKLHGAATRARCVALGLPHAGRGVLLVETLFVEDVQNQDDPDRCIFFKDWARSDKPRSRGGNGFAGLCVFETDSPAGIRRCTISVRPNTGASLRGLAAVLDRQESAARCERYGADDRLIDPETQKPILPRIGYTNADPWYDGRSHGDTIVDAPSRGTLLTVEQIETTLLGFASSGELIWGELRQSQR